MPEIQPAMHDARGRTGKAADILGAARREFLKSGFGAVSMDAIAREAGVSKATVYAHFAGKEELFGAVISEMSERYFGGFSASELDPVEVRASLTTLARQFLELLLSPDAIALNRIIIAEVTRFPALGEVFWQAGPERTRAQIATFLRRAAAAGSLDIAHPQSAADQFATLARGEIHQRHLFGREKNAGPAALNTAARGAVDTFLRAFGTKS
jgi:TetR/AcrR family transcriptional regulator, mexJK operon transcriptional repressor